MLKRAITVILCLALLAVPLAGCRPEAGETAEAAAPPVEPDADGDPGGPDAAAGEAAEPAEEAPASEPAVADWTFDLPENHGVDGALLDELHGALADTQIKSMLVVKDGAIIDEYYGDEYDETSVFRLHSCSKSFTGAMVGVAIELGLIGSVDDPIADYLDVNDDAKRDITVGNLLSATSGIAWYEWGGDGTSFYELVRSDNWVEYVLGRPMAAEPGTTFNYTTGGSHLLAAVVQQAAGQDLFTFAQEHVFGPAGMDSVVWTDDAQGVTDGGNGIAMTTRDAARFGQIYLNGGSWDGVQVIPESWVGQSTRQQSAGSGRSGVYGYQWWIRPFGDGGYDTYYAMGHGGQFIFVVPELELVCVITANYTQDTYAPWPYFTDYVLAACA